MSPRKPGRIRLRDKISSLDCLDLSTHSSALLSPFLSSGGSAREDEDLENNFPFRISPINSATAPGKHPVNEQLHRQQSSKLEYQPLARVDNLTLSTDHLALSANGVQPAGPVSAAQHDFVELAAASTPLVSVAAQHGQRAKRVADPRRESTALFKGFSMSSAESGLLGIEEIADINGSPEIVRHQHFDSAMPAPQSDSILPVRSEHSDQATARRTTASEMQDASAATSKTYSSPPTSSHVAAVSGNMNDAAARVNAASLAFHEPLQALHTEAAHPQQSQAQIPVHAQHTQSQHQQQIHTQPLQHAVNQPAAPIDTAEANVPQQPSGLSADEVESDAMPDLDTDISSPRLQALAAAAAADLPGIDGSIDGSIDDGSGMSAALSRQKLAQTGLQMPVAASSPAVRSHTLARHGMHGQVRESGSMRRSVGMRESMCLFLQLEGAVEGQNGFDPEEVLQLDEVRRQSGGSQHLPAVPEEEENVPSISQTQAAASSPVPSPSQAPTAMPPGHAQKPSATALSAPPQGPGQAPPKGATYPAPQQGYAVAHQKQTDQRRARQPPVQPVKITQPPALHRQHKSTQPAASQSNLHQRQSMQPPGVPLEAQHARKRSSSNKSSPGGSSPNAANAVDSKRSSPGGNSAVEHSSVSLSQLAGRSKLRAPSSLSSPPKRGTKAAVHKQATRNHLATLAANVPLPASPANDAKEAPAVVALATAVAKPSHIPAPVGKPSRLKKPTDTSGFFSSGRSFTNAQRPDMSNVVPRPVAQVAAAAPAGLSSVASATSSAATGAELAGQSGTGPRAGAAGHTVAQPLAAGPPNLARPSAPVQSAAAPQSSAASPGHVGTAPRPPHLARPSAPVAGRLGSQLPPSGAPTKTKSKGMMASVLGSVKKAVGFKSRTKDLQGEDGGSPKPERSAMSSMGFSHSHSRLPSMTGPSASANSSSHGTQRSGLSFSRKGRSFTRESTPPLSSDVEALLSNEELAFQGRGGGVGNSPADRAAKEASLRRSAQDRHWQDYSASLQ